MCELIIFMDFSWHFLVQQGPHAWMSSINVLSMESYHTWTSKTEPRMKWHGEGETGETENRCQPLWKNGEMATMSKKLIIQHNFPLLIPQKFGSPLFWVSMETPKFCHCILSALCIHQWHLPCKELWSPSSALVPQKKSFLLLLWIWH